MNLCKKFCESPPRVCQEFELNLGERVEMIIFESYLTIFEVSNILWTQFGQSHKLIQVEQR